MLFSYLWVRFWGTMGIRRKQVGMAVAAIASLWLIGCSERPESQFATREAAAELIKRGWIPEWLPDSTTDIYELHDLDTNEVWLRFAYAKTDVPPFKSLCYSVKQPPNMKSSGKAWWLKRADGEGQSALVTYDCSVEGGRLAVDHEALVAYYTRASYRRARTGTDAWARLDAQTASNLSRLLRIGWHRLGGERFSVG